MHHEGSQEIDNPSRYPEGVISRRNFLTFVAFGGGAMLLSACQGSTPAASPTVAPAQPSPAASPSAPKSPSVTPGTAASATGAAQGWQQQWDQSIEAARAEGRVVVSGPPSPEVRTALPDAFRERFGIELEYVGGRTGELLSRLESERLSGLYTLDAMIAGAQSLFTVAYPKKMLAPIPPALILPEVVDGSKWKKGSLWFMDPEQQYILRLLNYVSMQVVVNTNVVDPTEVRRWQDLLDPKYTGKISVWDPTVSGTGWNTASYLLQSLGEDFIRRLYQGQKPGVTRDNRQLTDWMARELYPISLGLGADDIKRLEDEGFPISVLPPLPEAPGYVTAGFGMVTLVDAAPHPNAAKLFMNWIASKEGQEVYNRANNTVSARADVDPVWAQPFLIPQPGTDYFDSNSWDYTINAFTPEKLQQMKELTGNA